MRTESFWTVYAMSIIMAYALAANIALEFEGGATAIEVILSSSAQGTRSSFASSSASG